MGDTLLAKSSKKKKKVEELTLKEHEAQLEAELKSPKKKKKGSKVSSGSISMYLAEIGKYDPLAPDKEVELAIRIQKNDIANCNTIPDELASPSIYYRDPN